MQFHNPEVLFALFLLIIPVIVHLFQLRKFRKESFTNVKFLKKVTRQTRKSSRLKKLLVLTSRLLLLSCIILAFSRPYFPSENETRGPVETVIYLDNSYSMQAEGPRGNLLERSKQELLEQLPEGHEITLITNSDIYRDVSRQDIQEIGPSPLPVDYNTVFLKARSIFSETRATQKKLLLISDFKKELQLTSGMEDSLVETYILPLRPQNFNNVSIDSAYYNAQVPGTGELTVLLRYTGQDPGNIPVSLYDGNSLLGKTSVEFLDDTQEIEFPISKEEILNGRIQIEDNGLQFDNTLYFSINRTQAITVTSINGAEGDFLSRIFTEPEFQFSSMNADRIDYSILSNSKVVVLNEVDDISGALATTLLNLMEEDAAIVVIPSINPGEGTLNLIRNLGFPGSLIKQENAKLVTGISYEHPLYDGVFDDRVRNFEYPRTQISFRPAQSTGGILSFEDNTPFLLGAGRNFLFTAPLNTQNSNFTQSPLIVPTFYNIALTAYRTPKLYYNSGNLNRFDVEVNIAGDRILEMGNEGQSFIPRQQNFVNKVEITTEELPVEPGNYSIYNGEESIAAVSFNIDRSQSQMIYPEPAGNKELVIADDLNDFFTASGYRQEVDSLWKWFITFALIFLVVETLLLKYFK
jgi:hypothetical protein